LLAFTTLPPHWPQPQPTFDLDAGPAIPTQDPVATDDFDQTPAFDPADPDPEPAPESDFDQTRGA
jgi:hypothetical protein